MSEASLWWKIPLIGIGVAIVGSITISIMSTVSSVVTAPSRVISKTLDTNNIISRYEYYRDASNAYQSRLAQVKSFKQTLDDTTDTQEKMRLRIDLNGIKQSCREIAAQYNANSEKVNQDIFKLWNANGTTVPNRLSIEACEG